MLSVPPKTGPDGQVQLHASTVVIDGKAVAFTGPTGSGKSTAAIAAIAKGAALLADDITWLTPGVDAPVASCPPTLLGKVEARGIGILAAPSASPAPLVLIVDLGHPPDQRLPEDRTVALAEAEVKLLHGTATDHFIGAILHYIRYGRAD